MIKTCVVCGKEFDARGKVIACSKDCRDVRNVEMTRRRRRRDIASGRNAEKQRTWRKNNPDAACLLRQKEKHQSGHYRANQRDWRDRNKDRVSARAAEKYWNGGGKQRCAQRFAEKQAALKLVRELQTKGIEALL